MLSFLVGENLPYVLRLLVFCDFWLDYVGSAVRVHTLGGYFVSVSSRQILLSIAGLSSILLSLLLINIFLISFPDLASKNIRDFLDWHSIIIKASAQSRLLNSCMVPSIDKLFAELVRQVIPGIGVFLRLFELPFLFLGVVLKQRHISVNLLSMEYIVAGLSLRSLVLYY